MLRFILKSLVAMTLLGVITLGVVSLIVIPDLPDIEQLRDVKMQIPLRVYSHDGSLIAEFGEMRRIPITAAEVPEQFINAFIAAEDNRFYQHPGVDWQGILRAVINLAMTGEKSQGGSTITMQVARNFFLTSEKSYMRKINEIYLALKIEQELDKAEILELYLNKIYLGHRSYGIGAAAHVYYGRDISQLTLPQMAMIAGLPKAPSTTNPVTSPERAKIRRSYVLGRMLDTGYISQAEFDAAIDSPVTASLHRPAVELEAPYVAEMVRRDLVEQYGDEATTAGFRVYTTIRDRNQAAANHALRTAVLEYDVRHGYRGPESHTELDTLTEDQHRELLETFPVIANLYPALITEVREQSVTAYLTGIGSIDIEWDGLQWARIYLNENSMGPAPASAADILKAGDIIRVIEDNNGQWKLSQLPSVEGALISLSSRDGSVLALTGGFDFYRSSFNRVTQAKRQPGSGFKPFIYSAALEEGFTTATIINDAPLVREFAGVEETWRPENYSGRYYGPTRLREALIHSRNIVSIRVLDAIGVDKALKHIEKFGFDTSQLPPSLSLALGSGEVTPWQMAAAYSVFSNGGYRIEPYFISRIEDVDGNMILEANPAIVCESCEEQDMAVPQLNSVALDEIIAPAPMMDIEDADKTAEADQLADPAKPKVRYAERSVDPQNIWIMNSITSDVVKRGTAVRARALNRQDLAGKTGTTNEQHDAWFFGYNPEVVTVTWVGFDSFRGLGINEVGGRAALPMWIDYMRVALADIPDTGFNQPPG
ncbi:MAG: penicillin-binding protein 1A, partial [Gammaproteobacteria bacterium]